MGFQHNKNKPKRLKLESIDRTIYDPDRSAKVGYPCGTMKFTHETARQMKEMLKPRGKSFMEEAVIAQALQKQLMKDSPFMLYGHDLPNPYPAASNYRNDSTAVFPMVMNEGIPKGTVVVMGIDPARETLSQAVTILLNKGIPEGTALVIDEKYFKERITGEAMKEIFNSIGIIKNIGKAEFPPQQETQQ